MESLYWYTDWGIKEWAHQNHLRWRMKYDPAFVYPDRFRQRIYELMHKYSCTKTEARELAEVEYRELGHIPKPQTDEIPYH